jgi:NAD(P)-dependent dehydrogenase (short-subunit alcohol dehydrogenase family)
MARRAWFITGVNSGFGRQMTEQLLERGDRVAGTVRKTGSMDALSKKYPASLRLFHLDLTHGAAIKKIVDEAFAEFGQIDVVVNNAGYGLFGDVEGLTDDQITHQIDTNLIGPILVTKAALPHLRSQGGGRIIAMSTYGGQASTPGASLYNASKWGMEGFFDAIHGEVASFNIGVTIIEPGGARTGFRSSARENMGQLLDAYKETPIAVVGKILSDPTHLPLGDPALMANIVIDSVNQTPAPKRIALGSDAFTAIQKALSMRLASIEAQKELAFSTDLPAT